MAGLTAIVIVLIAVGGIVTIALGYQQVQRHRSDAVALAGYRRLAIESAGFQAEVRDQLSRLVGTRDGAATPAATAPLPVDLDAGGHDSRPAIPR